VVAAAVNKTVVFIVTGMGDADSVEVRGILSLHEHCSLIRHRQVTKALLSAGLEEVNSTGKEKDTEVSNEDVTENEDVDDEGAFSLRIMFPIDAP
jgi:hypothetical protein